MHTQEQFYENKKDEIIKKKVQIHKNINGK